MSAAGRWERALAAWAIPEAILAQAPESPWGFPPALFAAEAAARSPHPPSAATRAALEAMTPAARESGGTVLDVGCGGGSAGLALVPPATAVTGVDVSAAMVAAFAAAATTTGVAHLGYQGSWPDVADRVPAADVVVCHHVAYNVGAIAPFVAALADHSRRRVVMEVTARHPASGLDDLWQRFWGLDRPTEPTAELLVAVVEELGYRPTVFRTYRPLRKVSLESASYVAFIRRRMCLSADRDGEIAAALSRIPRPPVELVAIVFDTP